MAKQNQNPMKRGPGAEGPSGTPGGGLHTAILVGVVILIAITGMNLFETRRQKAALDERLALLENQVTALGTKVDFDHYEFRMNADCGLAGSSTKTWPGLFPSSTAALVR